MSMARSTGRTGKPAAASVGTKKTAVQPVTTSNATKLKPKVAPTAASKAAIAVPKSKSSAGAPPVRSVFESLRGSLADALAADDYSDDDINEGVLHSKQPVYDPDEPLEDSVEESLEGDWEADLRERHDFLTAIAGKSREEEPISQHQSFQYNSSMAPAAVPQVVKAKRDPNEIRGLDEDDDDDLHATAHDDSIHEELDGFIPSTSTGVSSTSSSSKTIRVPTLFELCVEALGQNYHAITAQDVAERLPPGTLTQAIGAVRKAGSLTDQHLPLLFRTLTKSAIVDSTTWLQQDCGLDSLVSSVIEPDEEQSPGADSSASTSAESSSPSSSPAAVTVAKAAGTTPSSASRSATKPSVAATTVTPSNVNIRFAPLRGTPGVISSVGHSMNTATLARAAKAQKLAAQIAASNVQPNAKPNIKAQVAQVKTQHSTKLRGVGSILSAAAAAASGDSGGNKRVSVIPKDYIIASGELLDLHAQHRISEFGFRLLAGFMSYTRQKEAEEQNGGRSQHEQNFTPEQQARLAAVGNVANDVRALLQKTASAAGGSGVSAVSAAIGMNDIPRPVIDLASHFGIWRPVNIVCVDVSFSGIDSAGLQTLAKQCPNLLKLNICGCEKITNAGVASLPRYSPNIQVLLMEVLPCLDDRAIQDVVHGLKQLLSLDIGSCKKVSNVSFQIIGTHGKALKRLSAAGCAQTTDFDIEDLAKCVSLLSLSLRACGKITDDSATHLVTLSKRKKKAQMRGLQRLDIGGCTRLSDGSINALSAAYQDSLTHLDLRGLTRLTNRSIDAIQAHCYKSNREKQTLTELCISACPGITPERIQSLRELWPSLDVIV